MNEAIVKNWNETVDEEDTVYILGDLMLGDTETGLSYLKQLNGIIYIAYGNHCTNTRIEAYKECHNVVDVQMGYRIKFGKKTAILTHYPTITDNGAEAKVINLYGHTHQTNNFYTDSNGVEYPNMYHVGMDSHNCKPVLLTDIKVEVEKRLRNYKEDECN